MANKTKLFYGNQYMGSIKVNGDKLTLKQRFVASVWRVTWALFAITIGGWIVFGAWQYVDINKTNEAHADYIEITSVPDYPILDRIADCESGVRDPKTGYVRAIKGTATQFNKKTGQILMKWNPKSESIDIGYMQVNDYYQGKTASKMGYDLSKEDDNRAYGLYLLQNFGTEPWSASKSCWNR